MLAVRMRTHELLERDDDVRLTAELELEARELFACRELQLLEPRRSRDGERLEREVFQRPAADERKLGAQASGAISRGLVPPIEEALESSCVHLLGRDVEDVPCGLRADGTAAEGPAELGDVVLERMPGRLRGALAPDVLHQAIRRDGVAGAQRENGENGTLLSSAYLDDPLSVPNLERTEQLDL